MFTHPQQGLEQDDVQRLRQEAGRWLRALREKAGYSQRELARVVGLEYYTFISQIESGRGRVPPTQVRAWAEALGMPARDFAIELMRFYDPINHELIFGGEAGAAGGREASASELEARIARIESMLGGGRS